MTKKSDYKTLDQRLHRRDTDHNFTADTISNDIEENVAAHASRGVLPLKAYVTTLKKHKQKMSVMVENIIKTLNGTSQEKHLTAVLAWEKTSGKPSKMEYRVPLTVEPLTIHDVGHIVNDAFRDYLCRELPGGKRKMFNSLEFKEHLSLLEDIRCAEKDVMEVQERLLRVGDKGDWIELKPWNVENYSLLCPRMFVVNQKAYASDDDVKKNVYGIHGEMRRLRLGLNKERRMVNVQCCFPRVPRKLPILDKTDEGGLFVNTNIVRFNRFMPGGVYKKTVVITNAGKRLATFKLLTNKLVSFNYDFKPRCPLAAGMSAKLTVTFKCTSMEDTYELITLITKENKKVNILVAAENESPILKYTLECYDDMKDIDCAKLAIRSSSGVCLFECNACLVGARKTLVVRIKNIGRSSKFVLVPEDVWYTKPVEDVEWKDTMNLDVFTITPSIFEIDFEQSIALTVLFEPRLPSFYCTRFIIVSDNSCAQEVTVFGDGQMFGPRSVRLTGPGLQYVVAEEGSHVLDMGKIGEAVRYVYANNTSRIKYPYRWIVNHAIDNPGSQNAKVNFNVHPSTGILDKFSQTMFRVECGVTDEIVNEQLTGEYRVYASLMIDDVPIESVDDQSIFYEEQEDSPELLSINVAEIEVISEYKGKERISLYTDQIIIDLNWYRLRTDLCVQQTVCFINNGSCPVRVSWVASAENALASVSVEPESFEVADRKEVSVHVEPLRPGRLREALRFSTANRDGDTGETVVYVRGTVDRMPEVRVRPAIAALGDVCAGTLESYDVQLEVRSDGPFDVQRRLYEFDVTGALSLRGAVKSFGPYGDGSTTTLLNFKTPVETETTGIRCQLAEWSLAGSKTVYTQSVTYATLPVVRLNVTAVTIAECLYLGIGHVHRGIRLVNSARCDFVYSWGNPMGLDTDNVNCEFRPGSGTIDGQSEVEFELIVTPKKIGYFNQLHVPFFVQCSALAPQQISVECWVNDFSATITYVDACDEQYGIVWNNSKRQWIVDPNETENDFNNCDTENGLNSYYDTENTEEFDIEPEDEEPAKRRFEKRPRRDTPLCSPLVEQFERVSDYHHPTVAFQDIECNTAVKRCVTIRNTTKIPCQVNTEVTYYGRSIPEENGGVAPKKRCSVWTEGVDDGAWCGQDNLEVSVWVLATAWGRYEDMVTIVLRVGVDDVLPAVHIPIVIKAVTFPIEFPLANDVRRPTVNFSLYSVESENRLQIMNNSEIPVKISWRIYNESKENKPFGVLIDTLTPDHPDDWSFRITNYDGIENLRYFIIDPIILKLEPKALGYVTFSLDRTKEITINRNENNIVNGKAVGIVTALEPSGKNCIRKDGFKMKPTVVKLHSETRHSMQPNLVIRESDNIFKVSATQIYNSRSQYYTVTKMFTMCNHLQYPGNISFEIGSPFKIKSLRTIRCGIRPGNKNMHLFHEDLVEIELQAIIDKKLIYMPKMPTEALPRKYERTGYLNAVYENSYFKPKMVATFKMHIHFPVLKLSTRYINFGRVVVRATKSIDVMLSSYPGPDSFVTRSIDEVFSVSPPDGVASHRSTPLTISFRPKADEQYTRKIEILTTIPNDVIFLEVSGLGIKNFSIHAV